MELSLCLTLECTPAAVKSQWQSETGTAPPLCACCVPCTRAHTHTVARTHNTGAGVPRQRATAAGPLAQTTRFHRFARECTRLPLLVKRHATNLRQRPRRGACERKGGGRETRNMGPVTVRVGQRGQRSCTRSQVGHGTASQSAHVLGRGGKGAVCGDWNRDHSHAPRSACPATLGRIGGRDVWQSRPQQQRHVPPWVYEETAHRHTSLGRDGRRRCRGDCGGEGSWWW